MPHDRIVQLWRTIGDELYREGDDFARLERREGAKKLHGSVSLVSSKPEEEGEGRTDEVLASRSSRIIHSCATTHNTFNPTPQARRKSHSSRTSSRGGVQAQKVRREGKA